MVNATPQMPMPSYVPQTVPLVQVPSVPSGLMPIGTKRRQSNGTAETPAEGKPKRGRPRKVKKEDKYVAVAFVYVFVCRRVCGML